VYLRNHTRHQPFIFRDCVSYNYEQLAEILSRSEKVGRSLELP
jgi:hypothetical protein